MNLKSELRWLILIAIIAFGVFANSLGGDFVYDDNRQILRNPLIQDSTLYGKALTSDVWAFKGDGTISASNYYRPTFISWLILNFLFFGTSPLGWHFLNILLHTGVCLLIFLLLRRWKMPPVLALAITLIFAVHPVHSESVVWISGSPDLLFGVFLFSALWFAENVSQNYLKSEQSKTKLITVKPLDLIITLIFYAFALGSKEIGILCFPLFFLIFSRSTNKTNAVKMTIPFVIIAILYFAARWLALGAISLPPEDGVSLTATIRTIPAMFVFYLEQIIFPVRLAVNHSLRPLAEINFFEFALPLLISAAAIALFWLLAKKSFVQKFGFALFILTLAPAMSATAFPTEQIVHDRYLYLPLLGFLMMIFPYLAKLIEKIAKEKANFALILLTIIVGLPLTAKTFFYNQVWKNDLALWSHTVTIDKNSAFSWSQYGAFLTESGKTDEAIAAYNNSIDVRPTAAAFYGQARNLLTQNKFEEAVFDLKTVLEMPDEKINSYTLYQAYELMAIALVQQKKYDEAQKYLFGARKRLPIYYAALTEKLAVVMYQSGAKTSALRELEAAKSQAKTELLPESKTVLLRLGMLYSELGRKAEAKAVLVEYMNLTAKLQDNVTLSNRKQAVNLLSQFQ